MNERAQGFRLSPQQRRLWWLAQRGGLVHNAREALRLRGDLRSDALAGALERLVRRHSALRTELQRPAGMRLPLQRTGEARLPELERIDLSALAPAEREERIERLWQAEAAAVDLDGMPLLRLALLRLAEDDHLLTLTLHPLCADTATLDNLPAEIAAAYAAACAGRAEGEPAFPYIQFADWQSSVLEDEDEELRAFWGARTGFSVPLLVLPAQVEPPQREPEGRETGDAPVVVTLPAVEARRLEEVAGRYGAAAGSFLLAVWQALLWRLTRENEITVAEVYAFREEEVLADACGLFAKCLPVTARLQEDLRFAELLAAAGEEQAAVREFADGFLWGGVEEVNRGEVRPIAVGFEYSAWPAAVSAAGVSFALERRRATVDEIQLHLAAAALPDGLRLQVHAAADRFRRADTERLVAQLATLLRQACEEPEAPLAVLEILSDPERGQIAADSQGEARSGGESFVRRFERMAAEHPGRPAVRAEERMLDYGELNARANRLSRALRALGVGPDVLVALGCDRSPEMIVGLLGVLKAGGAYVPLDLEQPARRLAHVLEDIAAPVVLTERRLMDLLPPTPARVLCLDEETFDGQPADDPPPLASEESLAYVIFTSGSTGRPKGVAVERRQLRNYVESALERLELPSGAAFAMVSTFAADLGNTMLFPALATGGCLHLVSHARAADPLSLAEYFRRHGVGCLKIVPSHLASLLDVPEPRAILPRQRLIFGGEALPWELLAKLRELAPECRVFNHYGPSETTVGVATCATAELARAPRAASVPIGRPIPNTEIHLLDGALRPVPYWAPGEVYIGGANVTRGYLGRPDLTAESFVPDHRSGRPGARLYRTGDLARRLPDGNIEFIGRRDHQIKMHGFRIELGEIRAALNEHPQVRDSICILARGEDGRSVLIAYYVSRQEPEASELRDFLRSRVVEAAVPSFFVRLKRLPLTLNGKINHQALPSLEEVRKQTPRNVIPPRTAIEEIVAGMWTELLGVPVVSARDSFFELGGQSLLATRLVSRVRQTFRIDLSLGHLFEAPTLAGLSARVESALRSVDGDAGMAPPITPVPRNGDLPLSFAQERVWFMHQLEPDSPAYNIPAVLRLTGALRVRELARSLEEVVRRHEVLRTAFPSIGGRPLQVVSPAGPDLPPRLWIADLTALGRAAAETEAGRLAAAEAARPFDLARGPLLRAGLVRLAESEHLAFFTLHHIVSDAWSMDILVREVTALYNAFTAGLPSPLPEMPLQYGDFADWQRRWLSGEVLDGQLATWKRRLAGAPELTVLSGDRPRAITRSLRGGVVYRPFPADLAAPLRDLSRREGTTLFMTLLAGFDVLLHRLSGQQDLVVGTDVANRNHLETEGLIGFFVNNLALRIDLSGSPSFREVLQRVRETSLEAYAHQDLPFDQVVKALKLTRTLSHTPLFQILFVHQNAPASRLVLHGVSIARELHGTPSSKFDLALFIREQGGRLAGEWTYSTDLFDAATIERMARQYEGLLRSALENPDAAISRLEMASEAEREERALKELDRQEVTLSRLRSFKRRAVEDEPEDMVRSGSPDGA